MERLRGLCFKRLNAGCRLKGAGVGKQWKCNGGNKSESVSLSTLDLPHDEYLTEWGGVAGKSARDAVWICRGRRRPDGCLLTRIFHKAYRFLRLFPSTYGCTLVPSLHPRTQSSRMGNAFNSNHLKMNYSAFKVINLITGNTLAKLFHFALSPSPPTILQPL